MPYEIQLDQLPAGVVTKVIPGQSQVEVSPIEFLSSEDGDQLIRRLEDFGSGIVNKLPDPIMPGQISHLLAIIRRDKTATVYVNELRILAAIQPKREYASGDVVFTDDIADIHHLEFEGVSIPRDAGVILIFSAGWRRAIFYDLLPLHLRDEKDREYDIEAQLGSLYAYLLFQERFKIAEPQWKAMLDAQWFPFIGLRSSTLRDLLAHADHSLPVDSLVDRIAQELDAALPHLLARWGNVPAFTDHLPFLAKAIERYTAKDFISTTAIAYPRIEGLMRSQQKRIDPTAQASQRGLSSSAVKDAVEHRHGYTPLLPEKLRQYLEAVYFASFDPAAPRIKVSRNSIGHGVAAAEECSLKSATISLLLVDQLAHCFASVPLLKVSQQRPGQTSAPPSPSVPSTV